MPDNDASSTELKPNIRLLPFLCIVIALMVLVDGYRGYAILFISLGGLWLISYTWANSLRKNLTVRREMRFGWAQVGDRLEERFTLINDASVPAFWVEVIDQTNMPDYQADQVRGVNANSQNRWQTEGVCKHRGLYTLGPTTLRTSDPFGIYTVTIHDAASATLMVMPPVVPLPPIQVAPGGRAGDGTPRVNAPERTVSSASVREYIPGDSLRWIHWPTTARRNELFVRIFEGAPAGDWWIILDLDKQVQIGDKENSTQEHGIILAASLADQGMRSGRSVGLVTHGEDLVWLAPQMSDEHNWNILRSLALLEPGTYPLADLLDLVRPSLRRSSSLVVITSSLEGEWIEALIALRNQGAVPTVLAFDPVSFGGSNNLDGLRETLTDLGINYEIIPRDLLDRSEARPGREGHWQWRVTPMGRAIPVQESADLTWRGLSSSRGKN
jgi:uncharacterized protein (DUF58 family)